MEELVKQNKEGKQAEAKVVPSSSLVGVDVEVEVYATLSFRHSIDGVQILFQWGGWVAGWLEKWGLKLISTQVVVEVEVGVEIGNTMITKLLNKRKKENQMFLGTL